MIIRLLSYCILAIICLPVYSQKNITRVEFKVSNKTNKDFPSRKKPPVLKIGYKRYDTNGNIIEQASLNGNPYYYAFFDDHNNNGLLTKSEFWELHSGKRIYLVDSTLYIYDINNKLEKETEYKGSSGISRIKNYTISGNTTTSIDSTFKIGKNGSRTFESESVDTLVFDEQNRIKRNTHFYNGRFLYKEVYQYDQKGKIKTELRYDDQPDHLWSITEWKFDSNKKLAQELWKVIGGANEKKVYKYGEKGLLVKILFYSDDEFVDYNKFEYLPSKTTP